MEAILPFKIKNEQKFFDSALKVGYNEMEILKFIYVMQQSDLDIFPIMHDERINILLYGWELCEDYKQKLDPNEWELPEEMETVLKLLVPWSMDIWFSKEWDKSKYFLKTALIHCLNRARDLLMRMPDMMQINWDFLLLYNLKPWNVLYLKNLTVTKDKTLENGAQSIETEELPASDEDIAYVKLEQLPIIVLRLVKFFDQSSIDMVKTLCMRVLAAWNKIHQSELETSGSRRPYIPPEDKRCLLLICHIYLMAVYESDDVKGYVIDNMINNVRFYYQGFQNSTPFHAMDNFEYTPARYIALTNFHLRVQKRDFFDFFIWNKYDTSLVNLFGVVSQAYKSYLLGNLLMELNNMNEDDFASNIPLYKRLMNSYVNEREKSEMFLLSELTKLEHQRYAHNVIQTVKNITDCESKICKGNRMSNIGNYENSDDTVAPLVDKKTEEISSEMKMEEIKEDVIDEDVELEQKRVTESELRLDPVFQNLQNNESMLYYVYDVLAKKDYNGWHFAKVVLLVKLIGHEQNMVETWRYHPGLTTDFMLNLEVKLSHHYVDLAKIFKDHPFLEQEFWLTAFYLNPTTELYEVIKRLGMRNNRKRTDEHTKLVMSIDNIDAKYGLLSSTIDVKELAAMSNTDDPVTDYDPLFAALHSLRVPDSLIKDMLTAIFLPRNRSFAWAVDWVVLRNRCKIIMTSSKEKKRFVDLNMAEANERLKYLIIDYEKYKNRPQLDYGTIEQGYENLIAGGEFDKDSTEEEEEEEEDFEDDEDIYESKKRGRGRVSAATRKKEEEEKAEDDNSQEDDPFLMGKRRTRARTAATLASFLFQTLPRSSRRKRNQKSEEDEKISAENDDRSSDSKSPITTSETPTPSPLTGSCDQKENSALNVQTKNLRECLKDRPSFLNTTEGFQNLIDIWNVEKTDLEAIDENCVSLMESSSALQIAVKLKLLNREINPISCDEKEYIDEKEMIIHNTEYAIKMECVIEENEVPQMIEDTNNLNYSREENVGSRRKKRMKLDSKVDKQKDTVHMFKLKEENTVENDVESDKNKGDNIESSIRKSIEAHFKFPAEITAATAESDRNEDANTESSIGKSTEGTFKLPDETMLEKVSSEIAEAAHDGKSTESSFKLPEETAIEKEARHKANDTNLAQNLAKADENSNDSLNSDLSMAARKDSTEVSETNSKRNSFSIDIEMAEQIIQNDDLNDQTEDVVEKGSSKKLMETSYSDQEIANIQGEKCGDYVKISDDKENKAKECKEDQEEKPAEIGKAKDDNETCEENKAEDANEAKAHNQQKENEADDKTDREMNVEIKALQENKSKSGNETAADNQLSVEVMRNQRSESENETVKETKSEETAIEKENNAQQDQERSEKFKPREEPKASKENKVQEDDQASSNKADEETKETEARAGENSDDGISKNMKSSNEQEVKTIEDNSHYTDEIVNKPQRIESEEVNDNSLDDESGNRKETKKVEGTSVSVASLKHLDDSSEEENKKPLTELSLEKDENASKFEEDKENTNAEAASCSKVPKSHNEPTSTDDKNAQLLVEQNEDNQSEVVTVDKEKLLSTGSEKSVESSENQRKDETIDGKKIEDESNDQTKRIENEKTMEASSNQTKTDAINSTKAEDGSSDQAICETNEATLTNNTLAEATDASKNSESAFMLLDDTSMDSQKSVEIQDSTDSETRELKNLCLRKNVKVLVSKLRACDLSNLRQPKVKVQRASYEKYLTEFRPKRRRIEEKVYLEFDESSNSINSTGINSSSSEAYRPPKIKRKIPVKRHSVRPSRTSDSDNDSDNSDDMKLSAIISKSRKRRSSSPSSSAVKRVIGPKSAQRTGPKSKRQTTGPKSSKQNLVVTPRSASGLKLRISHAEGNRQAAGSARKQPMVDDEVIQLSSASSEECVWSELTAIQEEVIVIDDNPLFEEEIII